MNLPPGVDMREVSRWIVDLEDGVIEPEDRSRLTDLMRAHPQVRDRFLEHARLSALIHQTAQSKVELGTMPISNETLRREKRRSAVISLSYAAVAMLALGIGLWWLQAGMNRQPSAEWTILEGSTDARFAVVHPENHERPDDRLAPGDQINLTRGLLKFRFPSGVEALVEGPSQLELISDSTLRMDKGMGWFRVPENARGFTVRTELGRVIDLGTEFGIRFDARGDLEVHVADGMVKVVPSAPGARDRRISGGQALAFDEAGGSRTLDLGTSLFRREFAKTVPRAHWSFDAWTGDGFPASGTFRGIDDFILRPARLNGAPVDGDECLVAGLWGRALSLKGNGIFAEAPFPGIGSGVPHTVAAWVRFRGGMPASNADPRTGLGATTPFGHQAYLLNYTNARLTTAQGATGQLLEAGVTYTLSFHVASPPGTGRTEFRAELVAFDPREDDRLRESRPPDSDAGKVVATASGLVGRSDLSERASISFTPSANDPNLAKELGIRLVKGGGPVIFDQVRLSRHHAGSEAVVFSENFELPAVAGYAESVLPVAKWIGPDVRTGGFGSNRHGLLSQRPVFSTPFLYRADATSMWASFVLPTRKPIWSGTDGSVFLDAAVAMPRGQWTHVATVHTGRRTDDGNPEVRHYIDGTPVETLPHPTAGTRGPGTADSAPRLLIGALPGANSDSPTLDADIDELHIIRAALAEDEIITLMEKNLAVFRPER